MASKKLARTWTLEDFTKSRDEIIAGTAASLRTAIDKAYDSLTEDERASLSLGENLQFPVRLVKAILLGIGADVIDREWNAETLRPKVASFKRIMKVRRV